MKCPFCDGHFNYGVSSADDTTDTEVFQDGELGGTVADRHATPSPRKINRMISRVVKHKAILAASLLVADALRFSSMLMGDLLDIGILVRSPRLRTGRQKVTEDLLRGARLPHQNFTRQPTYHIVPPIG